MKLRITILLAAALLSISASAANYTAQYAIVPNAELYAVLSTDMLKDNPQITKLIDKYASEDGQTLASELYDLFSDLTLSITVTASSSGVDQEKPDFNALPALACITSSASLKPLIDRLLKEHSSDVQLRKRLRVEETTCCGLKAFRLYSPDSPQIILFLAYTDDWKLAFLGSEKQLTKQLRQTQTQTLPSTLQTAFAQLPAAAQFRMAALFNEEHRARLPALFQKIPEFPAHLSLSCQTLAVAIPFKDKNNFQVDASWGLLDTASAKSVQSAMDANVIPKAKIAVEEGLLTRDTLQALQTLRTSLNGKFTQTQADLSEADLDALHDEADASK